MYFRFLFPWLLVFMPMLAMAGGATLSWEAPTQNEDGTTLTDLAGYKLYQSDTAGGPYVEVADVNNPAVLTYDVTGLVDGTYYFVATAYNTAGTESAYSNEATKDVVTVPAPPGNLTVSNLTAFAILKLDNALQLIAIGTVPAGTECDPNSSVNGKYVVPWDAVTLNDGVNIQTKTVVAECG